MAVALLADLMSHGLRHNITTAPKRQWRSCENPNSVALTLRHIQCQV